MERGGEIDKKIWIVVADEEKVGKNGKFIDYYYLFRNV